MFTQLVILACLAGDATCQEFRNTYDAREISLITCMLAAQPQLAAWQAEHPKWTLRRWRCEPFDPSRADL